jgi:hypothetical protein
MKIKPEHYEHMKQAINAIPEEGKKAHFEYLKTDDRVKDINKRFRWDCFHAAKLSIFACDVLYYYLNDTHIDTALKAIVPERG